MRTLDRDTADSLDLEPAEVSEFDEAWEDEGRLRGAFLYAPIRSIDPPAPITVEAGTAWETALERMIRGRRGCVVVTRAGRLAGIFTERDVLTRLVGRERPGAPIDDYMTADPEALHLDDGLAYALNRMVLGGYRNVPLVDGQDRPVGVVAMRDIVAHLVSMFPEGVLNLPPDPDHEARRPDGG